MNYVSREIEKSLKKYLKQFSAVAITGPRQSGKSTMLLRQLTKKYRYITFDDILLRERALSDPKLFINDIGHYVILDEIQHAPALLSYLKIVIDQNRDKKGLFIFTGSQQFHLMKNIGDTLAGRVGILNLLPFSFNEILKKYGSYSTKKLFIKACLKGSYPELVTGRGYDTGSWYSSYIRTYIERDVRELYNIGLTRDFQRLLTLLAARCSQILNMSTLSRQLGVSITSIRNWISILEASQIIYLLQPYYNNLGKRITRNPKIYFTDCGIVAYLTGLVTEKHIMNGPLAGPLFENYCISEVLKHNFNKGRQENIYYLRTHNGLEIDMLIKKNQFLIPVEIKLTQTPRPMMADPILRFKRVFSKLNIKKGAVMCLTNEPFSLVKDISCINIKGIIQSPGFFG